MVFISILATKERVNKKFEIQKMFTLSQTIKKYVSPLIQNKFTFCIRNQDLKIQI